MKREQLLGVDYVFLYFFGKDPKCDLADHLADEPFLCDFILFYFIDQQDFML